MEAPKPFEFNEYVTRCLWEWSDPKIRLEKKRIRKQVVNQNSREWLRDIRYLSPLEINLLAENYADAVEWKKDHARLVRRAIFDEYTFKKLPKKKGDPCEDVKKNVAMNKNKNEPSSSGKICRPGEECSSVSLIQQRRIDEGFDKLIKTDKYQSEHDPTQERSVVLEHFIKNDGSFDVVDFVKKLVWSTLRHLLKDKITVAVGLMKSGILQQALLPSSTEVVDYFVHETKNKVNKVGIESLNELTLGGPTALSESLASQIFAEAPAHYIEGAVTKRFIESLIDPITKCVVNKYISETKTPLDSSHLRTIKRYVEEQIDVTWWATTIDQHVCTPFKIAEDAAVDIAEKIFSRITFGLDVPEPESEPSEPDVSLAERYKTRIAALESNAKKMARKNISHLKDPETVRKDINKKHSVSVKRHSSTLNSCKCATISRLGGKKKPFSIPPHKVKANIFFFRNVNGVNQENKYVTLYPKTRTNVKLLCDSGWKCLAVPFERELRDTPYRSSYAPPAIVNQIKKTKRIKASDRQLIADIIQYLHNNRNVDDVETIVKKLFNEKLIAKSPSLSFSTVLDGESQQAINEMISKHITGTSQEPSLPSHLEQAELVLPGTSHSIDFTPSSKSRSLQYLNNTQSARSQRRAPLSAHDVPKASVPQPYHKYVLEGYKYNMVPITPCRFHDTKDLKKVSKRFETAGGPAAVEIHYERTDPPIDVNELLPINKFVDTFDDWTKNEEQVTSLWTKSLNDSRLKRMAKFRKLFQKDPVFGFTSRWE